MKVSANLDHTLRTNTTYSVKIPFAWYATIKLTAIPGKFVSWNRTSLQSIVGRHSRRFRHLLLLYWWRWDSGNFDQKLQIKSEWWDMKNDTNSFVEKKYIVSLNMFTYIDSCYRRPYQSSSQSIRFSLDSWAAPRFLLFQGVQNSWEVEFLQKTPS